MTKEEIKTEWKRIKAQRETGEKDEFMYVEALEQLLEKALQDGVDKFFSKELQFNLLCGALSGGSNYWYMMDDITPLRDKYKQDGDSYEEWIFRGLQDGAEIKIFDLEDQEELIGTLTAQSMDEAAAILFEQNDSEYENAIQENDDANTADCWFQCAVCKSIDYG